MSTQRFLAREPFTFSNGAIGWRPDGPSYTRSVQAIGAVTL